MGWGKRIAIGALVFVGSCGAGVWYLVDQERARAEARRAEEASVKVTVAYDGLCSNREFPLSVTVYNGSRKTLKKAEFRIEAHEPGHSDDISDVLSRYRSWDKILPPGERASLCGKPVDLTVRAAAIRLSVPYVDPTFYEPDEVPP